MNQPRFRFDQHHSVPAPHPLPDRLVLSTLLSLTSKPDLDYGQFCNVAEGEPDVKERIMRAARAIRAGRESGVAQLRHAVAIIGLRRVTEILEVLARELQLDPAAD